MQMKGATGELFKYNSTWHAFKVIVKSEGVYGLFKGMWPNLLKVKILYNASFFIRQRQHEYPYHPWYEDGRFIQKHSPNQRNTLWI